MIEFIREIFAYRFLSHAAIACVLIGIACGIVGAYVVCRRLVFLAGGITHASFGGIGIAYYLGANPIGGALVFSVLSAIGMEATTGRGKIREDSAIGILWSLGMAIGIIFIYLTPGYAPNLMSFLFGNILTITTFDLWAMVALDTLLLLVFALCYRPILYTAFDREYAATQNAPVRIVGYGMMILTAVTIVLSIRLVGIVLLISLITIPPVAVNSLTRSLRRIMVWSAVMTAAGTFAGLFISYKTNVPTSAATILVLAAALVVIKSVGFFAKKRVPLSVHSKRRPSP